MMRAAGAHSQGRLAALCLCLYLLALGHEPGQEEGVGFQGALMCLHSLTQLVQGRLWLGVVLEGLRICARQAPSRERQDCETRGESFCKIATEPAWQSPEVPVRHTTCSALAVFCRRPTSLLDARARLT